jgi:hypothetical protein
MSSSAEDHFDASVMRLYLDPKEIGYNATYFLRMLSEQGGVSTVWKLIMPKTPS